LGGLAYLVQEALPFEEAGEEGAGAEDLPAGELGGGHRLPHPAYGPGQDLEGPLAEAAPSGWEASPFTAAWGTLCPGAETGRGEDGDLLPHPAYAHRWLRSLHLHRPASAHRPSPDEKPVKGLPGRGS